MNEYQNKEKDNLAREIQLLESKGLSEFKLSKIIGYLCLKNVRDARFYMNINDINKAKRSISAAKKSLKYKWIPIMVLAIIACTILIGLSIITHNRFKERMSMKKAQESAFISHVDL